MKAPFFSIITVCYNSENSILPTLKSVISQTNHDWEHIIIDGGSTDNTLRIIQDYLNENENVFFLSEKDSGIYDAMNKGIKMAKGCFLFFLNSADVFHDENVLQNMYKSMSDFNSIYYGCICYGTNGEGKIKKEKINMWRLIWARTICHQTIFAPRELLKNHLFDLKFKICADQEWIYYCKSQKIRFRFIDCVICDYDLNGESSNEKNKELCIEERFLIQKKYYPVVSFFRRLIKKMGDIIRGIKY